MNIGRKRSWMVRLWRVPRAARQRSSNLLQRIPPKARFFSLCALLVLLTTLLVSHYTLTSVRQYQPGDIVDLDVIVPVDLQVVDRRATEERQQQARERVAPIFVHDHHRALFVGKQLADGLEALGLRFRQRIVEEFGSDSLTPAQRASELYRRTLDDLAKQSETRPSPFYLGWPPEAIAALAAQNFSEPAKQGLVRATAATLRRLIYDEHDAQLIASSGLQLAPEPGQESAIQPTSPPISVAAARPQLAQELQRELPQMSRQERDSLAAALGQVITPNLKFDRAATEAARRRAEEMTQPVIVSLKRNRVLLRAGDVVSEELQPLLEEVRQYQLSSRQPQQLLSLLLVVALVYYVLYQAATRGTVNRLDPRTAFWVAASAVLMQTALVRAGAFIAAVLSARPETMRFGDAFVFQFAIPFAACALVLSLLVGSQLALVAALVVSLLTGLISSGGIAMTLFALASSITAIYSVERYRARNAITRAILIIGGVNISMGAVATLIANRELTWDVAAGGAILGMSGALLTAGVASLATPIYESAFDILTDMKLLELSNADLPLLRQLAIQTPGTNHHSFIVSTLAEAAAKAVGANPLLARIGCLYHDIGKLAAPNMYIENQQGGPNPHDRVEPRDSVRIITGHVRRGLQMAHEANLPPQIIDFIPQHHGTRVLSYFYHKAKAQAEARGETVNISDFRYPGPKPQTKEAVILMLSDAAEAAVRSLEEPTPENIRAIIKKIVDSIMADGQLDECTVTMREVTAIRESLVSTLTGIYHQRISYPGFNPPSESDAAGAGSGHSRASVPADDQEPSGEPLPQHVHAQSPH
jgi:putative nucleotidyltransferase with HDIG domain